jgi:phosphate:Na+ symporter
MSQLNIILAAVSGIILFLFGLENFSKEVQRISGEKFKQFLAKTTRIPIVGLIIGALVTSLVQSSSATSVIAIGLVNAGIISFKNSLGIIFGANVGTTITAQLIAFKLTNFAPYIIILGFIISITKTKYSFLGKTIFYFGFVFFSLNLISHQVAPLQHDPDFIGILSTPHNMYLSILIGALFTAIVQSSSVTTGMAIIFTQSGMLSLENAVPLIIGANIGTTINAIFVIFKMELAAKRAALSHILFNFGGVIIFLPFISLLSRSFSTFDPAIALANIHLIFNLITSIIFIIFITPFSNLIMRIFPTKDQNREPIIFPNLSAEIQFEEIQTFINKGFAHFFFNLKENYHLVTLSIESNYKNIYEKVKRNTTYVDSLQKDFTHFFASLINKVDDQEQSKSIIIYINEFEYLYQVHDTLKDILEVKEYMMEMYIEMHSDMLFHYREISSRTLNIMEQLHRMIQGEVTEANTIKDQFMELQADINNFSRALFKVMPDTNRSDTGNNMHFMTYSQRLRDKLSNLFKLLQK